MADQPEPSLFNQIVFHIVISKDLSEDLAKSLAASLTQHGAEQISPPSKGGRFEVKDITHIISATIDFESYDAATNVMISVIKPSWISSSLTKMKMANPRLHSPDPKLFFSGLMVHIADLPENDKNAIIGGLEAMGGIYASAITRQVTHIVAMTLEPDACKIAVTKQLNVKIVLPHWFNDCLRLGRRISEGPYLLPDPEILEPLNGTHPRSNRDLRLIGVSAHIDKNALTPPSSPVTRSVFKRHKIMLSKDLGINEHLESTILAIVESAGGHLVHSVKEADTLVCQYRESRDFREAGAADLVIGNLPWLYHIISSDSWTSPMRRLLHFPISQTGLPGFRAYRISLSNYNGDARLYLENLAKAAGCEFTKSMKQDNTHLITAHSMSEKCDAAKEWNIHMVNHLWLEDSYAKWAIQSVATSRYTHFPARTNLGEVVGQTEVDKEALKTYFLPSKDKAPAKAETTPATNTENKSKSERPDGTNRKPDVPKSSPALSHRIKDVNSTPATSRKGRRSVVIEDMSTPAPVSAGKENETPSTGGRSAKAKAMSNMAGYAEDFAKLAKEKKQKGGIIYGGRSSEDRVQSTAPKRSMSLESESGQEEPKPKRSKKANVEPKFKLLVTGYQDWSQDQDTFRGDSERLAQLGIELIEDPIGCSYLVAPKILRTKKFVCAMAGAPTILSINFALDCLTQDKLLNPKDYPLIDKVGEDSYHFKLADAVKRAKANQGHLLKGQTLFITQDVRGGPQTYRDIIEVNGGKCTVFKGRSTSLAIAEQSEDEMTDPNGFLYLISGTSKPETNLWPKFQEQVEAEGREARIVKTDWMLDIALSQKIRWDRSYEAKADES